MTAGKEEVGRWVSPPVTVGTLQASESEPPRVGWQIGVGAKVRGEWLGASPELLLAEPGNRKGLRRRCGQGGGSGHLHHLPPRGQVWAWASGLSCVDEALLALGPGGPAESGAGPYTQAAGCKHPFC